MSSYLLDRDLLSSGRGNSSWIDVNSNAGLLGQSTYQKNDSDLKKTLADLQDQLRMLKHDVDRKDALINELSSVKEIEKIRGAEAAKIDAIYSIERQSADTAKRELAAIQAKYEAMATELTETKLKVAARDERINEIKREMETIKNDNNAINQLLISEKTKMRELERDLGGFETVASKSGLTISTLQSQNKSYQEEILTLESRLRTYMTQREEAERKTDLIHNKLSELAGKVTCITGTDIPNTAAGLDLLITKINDIVNENTNLKGKLVNTTDKLSEIDTESKANRETIQRLVNELNKFEKESVNNRLLVETLKAERDSALSTKTLLEKEIDTLRDRISNIQNAWQSTKSELDTKESKYGGIEANLKQFEYDILFARNCLNSFKEQVASLLSDSFVKVNANEDEIKEKIKLLMTSSKDRGLMIASMDGKVQQLATQLQEQINLYKELEVKYQRAEHRCHELESKFNSLDGEFCASQVLRDNLKSDRVKYLTFLEKIGSILRVNEISADVGLDMNVDLLLARAEQLVKMENDSLQDKQTNIYNLQRKLKTLKEQYDSKELHLELLRKKVTALEEEKCGKSSLEKEVDDHVMMSKKLKVKVDKMTQQLSDLKHENTELKAQLMDCTNLKQHTQEQSKEIHRLQDRIKELECERNKYLNKISKLKDDIDNCTNEISKTRDSSDNAVGALSQELRQFKQDIDRYKQREKQLLDFRDLVARILGLDVSSLSIPDYEIIARLERVVATLNDTLVHQTPINTVLVPSLPPRNLHDNLYLTSDDSSTMNSHHHHNHHNHHRNRSPSPQRKQNHNHHHHHHNQSHHSSSQSRTRSKSPRKMVTIDPNSY